MHVRILILGMILSVNSCTSRNTPVEFITAFYRDYLNYRHTPGAEPIDSIVSRHHVFSKSAAALLDLNHKICREKAGTDVCGFDADQDIFLNSQETGPDLDFQSSHFGVETHSSNIVDVSFTVWPGSSGYDRTIRYFLVREDGAWHVDDMIFGDKGKFTNDNSMRSLIRNEIALYAK